MKKTAGPLPKRVEMKQGRAIMHTGVRFSTKGDRVCLDHDAMNKYDAFLAQ